MESAINQESLTASQIFELVRERMANDSGIMVPEGNPEGITRKLLDAIFNAIDTLGISIGLKAGTRFLDLPRKDRDTELTRDKIEAALTSWIDALDPHFNTRPDIACPMRGVDTYQPFLTYLTVWR